MLLNSSALFAVLRVCSFAGPQTQEAGTGVYRAPALHHTKEQEFAEVQPCSGSFASQIMLEFVVFVFAVKKFVEMGEV